MPQFVLLEHDHPELHWDFMLESGDALLTWRLDRIPAEGCEFDVIGFPIIVRLISTTKVRSAATVDRLRESTVAISNCWRLSTIP